MQGNLAVMGNDADHMAALQPQLENVNKQLQQLSEEQSQLTQLSAGDQLTQSETLNTQFNGLNTQVSVLGISDGQDSSHIAFLSSQDNAEAGLTQAMIDTIINKEARYRG